MPPKRLFYVWNLVEKRFGFCYNIPILAIRTQNDDRKKNAADHFLGGRRGLAGGAVPEESDMKIKKIWQIISWAAAGIWLAALFLRNPI